MGTTSRRGFKRDVAGVRPRRARSRRSPLVGWLAAVAAASLLMVPGVTWADEAPQPTEPVATSTGSEDLDLLAGDPADPTSAPTETTPTPTGTTPTPTDATPATSDSTPPAGTGSISPTADPSTSPSVIGTDAGATSPQARTAGASPQSGGDIMPLAVGTPDGGTAPYVYWDVKDQNGNLVSGATFKFEYRSGGSWTSGTNANPLSDCNGTCSTNASGDTLDRDSDGGEFLLEHFGTSRGTSTGLVATNNYRVTPVTAPAGYAWVDTTARSINGNNNSATWNVGNGAQTHGFGTFVVQKLQTLPICTAGNVYGLNGDTAQIQQVAPGGAITPLGSPAATTTSDGYNGLGIGYGGSPVYAYSRSDSTATVMKYDTTTGQWSSTGKSNANDGGGTVTFVTGAVNLQTGTYMFGGFGSAGSWPNTRTVFRFWEYKPATDSVAFKGFVEIEAGTANTNNGDMAFDAAGNLFIVRNTGTSTNVFSVTAANLAAATGSTTTAIPSSPSQAVSTMSGVNGIAFDSDGKGYLSSNTTVRRYDMPGWTNGVDVTTSLNFSRDLASCSSPPTITIEKEVQGGRNAATDQFTMTLTQGTTTIGTATTTGNSVGVQGERVGPLPTVRGVPLTFTETPSGTTILTKYASTYRCLVDNV